MAVAPIAATWQPAVLAPSRRWPSPSCASVLDTGPGHCASVAAKRSAWISALQLGQNAWGGDCGD